MNEREQRRWVRHWWFTNMGDLADNAPDLIDGVDWSVWADESRRLAKRIGIKPATDTGEE